MCLSWTILIRINRSLYKRYQPAEVRRIIKRLEIHYTPKHRSWLDIAEIELNVMTRQCLSKRIDNLNLLRSDSLYPVFTAVLK